MQWSTQTQRAVTRALEGGPWQDQPWDERARRIGGAMLTGLRESLPNLSAPAAVASAASAARAELPLAPAASHEMAARVTLVWAARRLTEAAESEPDAATGRALVALATEMAAGGPRLACADEAAAQAPFEVLVEATREAFTTARDDTDPRSAAGPFLAVYLHQLKHIASLLVVGGHSVDELVRGAVQRADRVARKDGLAGWHAAPLAVRRQWVRRGLVEAAWALAARAHAQEARREHGRAAGLWLARTASLLLARAERATQWLPESAEAPLGAMAVPRAEDKQMDNPPGDAAPEKKAARTMSDKIAPVLKTLEADAGEAAWRLAGSQFVKLAREPIVALLSRHLAPDDPSLRARIAGFLETELGASLLAALLSVGLQALPMGQSEMTSKLARELRVKAMAGAGDAVADVLMGPLRQVAVLYLQGVPTGAAPGDPAALPSTFGFESLKTDAEVAAPVRTVEPT